MAASVSTAGKTNEVPNRASSMFDGVVKRHLKEVVDGGDFFSGYIDDKDNFDKFLAELKTLGYGFSIRNSGGKRGAGKRSRFLFSCVYENEKVHIHYQSPFQIVRDTTYECVFGGKYRCNKNKNDGSSQPLAPGIPLKKKRFHIQPTKKRGCLAKMLVKELDLFPEYKGKMANWRQKKKILDVLRKHLEADETALVRIHRYLILISKEKIHNHSNDNASTQTLLRIHPDLVKKIKELVQNGFNSVRELRPHLHQHVADMFKTIRTKPDVLNSAFYPSDAVIYAHMHHAMYLQKKEIIDQDVLVESIEDWGKNQFGTFYFRPYQPEGERAKETLLFCHQADYQKELLAKYGDGTCSLDAIYKITKSPLPLYFVEVKTNMGYQVIGTIVVQQETAQSIAEGLRILLSWNQSWNPSSWMTDSNEDEINAVRIVFPNAKAHRCCGVEAKNREIKHTGLKYAAEKSLAAMLKEVVTKYLPSMHITYRKRNAKLSSECREYNSEIPSYLHNRPHKFIRHVLTRIQAAQTDFRRESVYSLCSERGVFQVYSQTTEGGQTYTVNFETPSCSCQDFEKWKYPCKHFAAVFLYTGWSFDKLPKEYRENPMINIETPIENQLPILTETEISSELAESSSVRGEMVATFNQRDNAGETPTFYEIDSKKNVKSEGKKLTLNQIKKRQASLRNRLRAMIDMSYECESSTALEELGVYLKKSAVILKKSTSNKNQTNATEDDDSDWTEDPVPRSKCGNKRGRKPANSKLKADLQSATVRPKTRASKRLTNL